MPVLEMYSKSYDHLECLVIFLCVDIYTVNTDKQSNVFLDQICENYTKKETGAQRDVDNI